MRDIVTKGLVEVAKIATEINPTDMLTKAIPVDSFELNQLKGIIITELVKELIYMRELVRKSNRVVFLVVLGFWV